MNIHTKSKNNKLIVIVITLLIIIISLLFIASKFNNNIKKDVVNIGSINNLSDLLKNISNNLKDYNIKIDYEENEKLYNKLINKKLDMIITSKPTSNYYSIAVNNKVELIASPLIDDALVFFTSKNSTINNLSFDQLKELYIKKDQRVYISSDEYASNSLKSQVLVGYKIDLKSVYSLDETVKKVIDNNDTIGYTTYYEYKKLNNKDIKLISIDGVLPENNTIKNSTYPLKTSYYIITLKDESKEVVGKLKNDLLSSKGQKIAREAGYVELGK